MLKTLDLHGVGPVENLSAEFGSRLNVITGDNGLGKSFLLDVCFWALTGTWPGGRTAIPSTNGKIIRPSIRPPATGKAIKLRAPPSISFSVAGKTEGPKEKACTFDYQIQTWNRPAGRPMMPGLVIYAAVDGSFAVWDPSRNYSRARETGTKQGSEQPRAYQFTADSLANGLREDEKTLCNGMIDDWDRWYYQRSHKASETPFAYLESVVKLLSHPDEPIKCGEPKRVFVDDARMFPVLEMPYGEVPLPHWSAGVRRVMGFAYLLVWAWFEHAQAAELRNEVPTNRVVLIVDEIEAHLHPKWQRMILPAVLGVADELQKHTEVQVFAATHSPLVLASLEPTFDQDTDQLYCFNIDTANGNGHPVTFDALPWAVHGDVVGWLTSDIFGLEQARSKEAENAIEAAEAFLRGDTAQLSNGLKSKNAITAELKRVLSGIDPYWPRWIVEAK